MLLEVVGVGLRERVKMKEDNKRERNIIMHRCNGLLIFAQVTLLPKGHVYATLKDRARSTSAKSFLNKNKNSLRYVYPLPQPSEQ